MSALEELAAAIVRYDKGDGGDEGIRARARAVVAEHAGEEERLRGFIADQAKTISSALADRDAWKTRAEDAIGTVRLWERTARYLPAVGIACDVAGCSAAIGIVGVRAVATDDVARKCREIARLAGWTGAHGKDRCPDCTRKEANP